MNKIVRVIISLFFLCIFISACGRSEEKVDGTEDSSVAVNEPASLADSILQDESSVGGWISKETGAYLILENDGSGVLRDKVNIDFDKSQLPPGTEIPEYATLNITWKEDDTNVSVTITDNEIKYEKQINNGVVSSLEINGYIFIRMSDEELQEYSAAVGTSNASEAVKPQWVVQQEKDAFGDVVENGESYLSTSSIGTFSNSATTSSDLNVQIDLLNTGSNNGIWLYFHLFEYGDIPVSPLSSIRYSMSIKDGNGDIDEFDLETIPGSNALAFIDHGRADGKNIYNCLCLGQDIRCIINTNSSKYNFTIESSNFVEACEEIGYRVYVDPSSIDTIESALMHLAAGEQWDYGDQISKVLEPLYDELEPMGTEEIEEAIKPGYWLECNPRWDGKTIAYIFNEDGTRENYEQLEGHYYGHYSWKIDDNGFCLGDRGTDGKKEVKWSSPAPVRKIKEGWYFVGNKVMVELNNELMPAYPLE